MKKQAQTGGTLAGGRLFPVEDLNQHIRSILAVAIRIGGRAINGFLSIKCRAVVKGDLPLQSLPSSQ